MIPAQFDYVAPTTPGGGAGGPRRARATTRRSSPAGQSLLPVLRMRLNAPELVIDIGKIESLRGVRDDGDSIVIGAMTAHDEVLANDLVREQRLVLTKAVSSSPTRRCGTAAPSAARSRTPTRRVTWGRRRCALDAEFVIAGPRAAGRCRPPTSSWTSSRPRSARARSSPEVRVPKRTGWGAHYEKFVRVAHQWPIVAVAAAVKVDGGTISEARVGLTNMGATPLRAPRGGGGPGRPARHRRGGPGRGGRPAAEGTEPALGPQRRRRLPAAPGDRADPACGARRGGGVIPAWS